MNERITELAKQAGLKKDHASDKEYIGDFDWRQFAELIVRECGEVAYKAYWDNPETVKGRHIEEQIRKHFGVKE